MSIRSVIINVADVDRAVQFYATHLDAVVVEASDDAAVLDLVTATLRLRRVDAPTPSSWVPDDLQAGFRHIGFKVADLDVRVAALQADGVPFQLEPIDAEGEVRITFFLDPDGTLVEMVQGPIRYHEHYDPAEVERDWALGTPERPRFDHVAETVADEAATSVYFAQLGFVRMGGIHQPSDPRGFEITYLRAGDSALELFAFERAELARRAPQLDALGFAAVVLDGSTAPADATPAAATPVGDGGHLVDADGLVHVLEA